MTHTDLSTSPADALLALLAWHALAYDIVEHEAVFTIADALAAVFDETSVSDLFDGENQS